ncbi:DNA adenine methylase [Roseomonas xinghualingensis]|uniref:DNA adenine methylase n=1 Tax=Roseomonas xinghualingensis TaxID=2986475 RepID=UPI0021F10DFD|nr:DNA adenine methylase [Roseomonas sp. SXEYE001]MCV4210022.1 DNA adenine methylase [Roseomonas sp. SXEYE001]
MLTSPTPAPYLGGKRNLARRVIARIEAIPHRTYAEPFVGMGGVFLRRSRPAPAEVINDLSADVANLFRILQRHYVQLMDTLRWQVTSRAEFTRLCAANADTLTDLERAARFLYLQRLAFGGKVRGRTFGIDPRSPGRFDVNKLGPQLEAIHDRLSGVVIERLHYAEFLCRYDRPETLFYLDPPYFGNEGDYGEDAFSRADFERLAEVLAGLKGRFLLSLNDHPEVRRIFAGFHVEEVEVTYTVGSRIGCGARRGEVLISGPA